MKLLALTLIHCLLAYGGKPRKALPKTPIAPINDNGLLYDSNVNTESFWDETVSSDADQVSTFSDDNTMKFTVPVFDDVCRKSKIGSLPRQKIAYRMGAKVLTGDVAVYIIYYGHWETQQKNILNEFTGSLGESCMFP